MIKRLSATAIAGAFAMIAFAPAASADPKTTTIPLTCNNGQTLEAAFNGNGDFTPGHVVGSTQTFVIQSLQATATFTPTGGDPVVVQQLDTSKPHVHGDLVTCHFDFVRETATGSFHGVGTSVVFITPAS
ncbi:hypothetical protein ASE25_09220 [Terrabacter sp. Root85]|uniref:hypothetical protein n=1 Tax=unclassified Terrabacter TaxID=2630222 RepID=UPI0006F8F9B0|nr:MULTISPECIES: hypothetical protein [unclassified Terrabacter]KRC89722.1 hypothetical protein ASE25_09220 [Terrabacter sp. Root85]KRF41955.1 hypothetical protein ASH01_17905 [Terrabacter sp. Soil811]